MPGSQQSWYSKHESWAFNSRASDTRDYSEWGVISIPGAAQTVNLCLQIVSVDHRTLRIQIFRYWLWECRQNCDLWYTHPPSKWRRFTKKKISKRTVLLHKPFQSPLRRVGIMSIELSELIGEEMSTPFICRVFLDLRTPLWIFTLDSETTRCKWGTNRTDWGIIAPEFTCGWLRENLGFETWFAVHTYSHLSIESFTR